MGVPVIGCSCPVCTSKDEKNKRTRPSALLKAKQKTIVIDAGPDFRTQALREGLGYIDGVIFTHAHHDHTAGLDDLRVFTMKRSSPMPCLMSESTAKDLKHRYEYIFQKSDKPKLVSKVELHVLNGDRGESSFLGIPFRYLSYIQSGMPVNGFRFGNLAFVTDIKEFPETVYEDLQGIEVLVVSALRHGPSYMHLTVEEAVDFSRKVGASQTWLTHIAHELDHEETNRNLPSNVRLAYDGLTITFQL